MSAPTRPVPTDQQVAFELAVAERLGIDPQTASMNAWRVDEEGGRVTLDFFLDGDELLEMFDTGKSPRRSLRTAVQAASDAMCTCDGAGCEETFARRLLLSLLAEQKAGA